MHRLIVTMLLAGVMSACTVEHATEAEAPQAVVSTTAALAEKAPTGDDGSLHAIVIHWDDTRSEQLGKRALDVVIENTTDDELEVTLEIAALNEDGTSNELSRALGVRAVPPHKSVSVAIGIDEVPVQVIGADAPVWIRASYGIEADTALTGRKMLRHVAVSEMRAVTFDEGYRTAAVRDSDAQLAHNGRLGDAKRVTGKRAFDRDTGTLRAQAVSAGMLSSRLVPKNAPHAPPMPQNEEVAP